MSLIVVLSRFDVRRAHVAHFHGRPPQQPEIAGLRQLPVTSNDIVRIGLFPPRVALAMSGTP